VYRKRRLSALPNVGPYTYDGKISGFTRSSIYIYTTLVGYGLTIRIFILFKPKGIRLLGQPVKYMRYINKNNKEKVLFRFDGKSGYPNASQCYIIRALAVFPVPLF
jgi:hypothetical protein